MFKFQSITQVARRAGVALALAVSIGATLLPTVAMAAPLEGQYGHGGPGCANYYIVQKGDTLSGIAARYGTGLWALREANDIGNIDRIYAGQYICITGGYNQGGYNQGGYPGGHQNGYPGGNQGHYANGYTVCAGDNLSSIARRYHTSVWWLMQANHLSNPNHIYTGQVLRVG